MAKSTENLIRNLDYILKANRTNATRFCELCEEFGIKLTRSTLSRVMQGGNTGLETVSDITLGVHSCFPDFSWVTEADLISDKFNSDVALVSNEKFRAFICKLLQDLNQLEWITVQREMETIADFSTLVAKDFGIETDKSKIANPKVSSSN